MKTLSTIFTILLTTTLTTSLDLNPLIRAATPSTLVGTFTLQTPPTTGTCPQQILHSSYNTTNNPLIYYIPHENITQDTTQCNDYSYLTVYSSSVLSTTNKIGDEEAVARDDYKKFISNNTRILAIAQKLQQDGVDFYVLLERQDRICGNTARFSKATIGFVMEEDNDVEIEGVGTLDGGERVMVLFDEEKNRVCVYQGNGEVEDVMPANSPTPSAVASPNEGTVAVGEDGDVVGVVGEITPEASGENADEDGDGNSDDEDDDGGECFPGDAEVELENGDVKLMKDVRIGERVRVGKDEVSQVFMFTHRLSTGFYDYVQIKTESLDVLHLTKGHYIYTSDNKLVAASTINVGDNVQLKNGQSTKVVHVGIVNKLGLYNPQTAHGDIVVNGFRTSTYTTAVEPKTAHALLAPLRMVYQNFGVTLSLFENGASSFVRSLLPRGQAVAL